MTLPVRESVRLRQFDYGEAGYYFVTICTMDRKQVFGEIVHGQVRLSPWGRAAAEELEAIEAHRADVRIEKWIVMPNHVHAVIRIVCRDMTCHVRTHSQFSRPQAGSLGMIVGAYKAAVTRRAGVSLWQKGYYERVIRDEGEYLDVWKYIDENPLKWAEDAYYP